MKQKYYPTVNNHHQIIVYYKDKQFRFFDGNSMVQWLMHNHKKTLLYLVRGTHVLFSKATNLAGVEQDLNFFYRRAYYKNLAKKPKIPKKVIEGTEKNYLFSLKIKSHVFEDEPAPRNGSCYLKAPSRYDDPWFKKTQKSWKNYRKTQYKIKKI